MSRRGRWIGRVALFTACGVQLAAWGVAIACHYMTTCRSDLVSLASLLW
jgi:hypothetical protein